MNLCKNCKWCTDYDENEPEFAKCKREVARKISKVSGKAEIVYPEYNYCFIERQITIPFSVHCGKRGKWYQEETQ